MPTLTDAQIAGLAKGVGLSGDALVKSVAIAIAESSGRSDVLGPPTRFGRAVGLWQIMPLPGRPSAAQLKDPNVNAQQMYKISSKGTNWTAWEVYTKGSYLQFMPRAKKAAGNPDGSGVQQVGLGDVVDSFENVVAFFQMMKDPGTWLRLIMFFGGGAILLLALARMSGQVDKLKAAVDTATDYMPQTRGVKAAMKGSKGKGGK